MDKRMIFILLNYSHAHIAVMINSLTLSGLHHVSRMMLLRGVKKENEVRLRLEVVPLNKREL